jgi:hypothetical protein
MKPYYFPLFVILLIGVVLISGCINPPNPPPFKPSVELELDKSSITVTDNTISTDFITATITRLDNENIDTVFLLKFPERKQTVYPTDVDGHRITELQTKPLKGQNCKDTLQFKIFGTKGEDIYSVKSLKLELWWNNTKIDNQDKTIEVKVE